MHLIIKSTKKKKKKKKNLHSNVKFNILIFEYEEKNKFNLIIFTNPIKNFC